MKRKTISDFLEAAKDIHGDTYDYSQSVYTNATTKIIIKCKKHGIFLQRPNDHISGKNGCPACKSDKIGNLKRLDVNEIINRFKHAHGDTYDYSSVVFKNLQEKVTIICKTHGNFEQRPTKHCAGQGCPRCKYSSGERIIFKVLTDLDVRFECQQTFKGLMGHHKSLKLDFYIPDFVAAIEFDGEFHFDYTKIFNYKRLSQEEAINEFLKIKEYDALKNIYCKENGIRLLRIPFNVRTYEEIMITVKSFLQI